MRRSTLTARRRFWSAVSEDARPEVIRAVVACADGALTGAVSPLRPVRAVAAVPGAAVGSARCVQLGYQSRVTIVALRIVVVVGADVTRPLGPLLLLLEGLDHGALDHLAAGGVDR